MSPELTILKQSDDPEPDDATDAVDDQDRLADETAQQELIARLMEEVRVAREAAERANLLA